MKRIFLAAFCLVPFSTYGWTLASAGLLGWKTRELTVRWSSANCPISSGVLSRVLDASIAVWNKVSTADLKLVKADSETTVDITTFLAGTASETPTILCDSAFSTNNAGASKDSVPALTRLGSSMPLAYGGIVLNAEVSGAASIDDFTEDQLTIIIAHELGHLLGLGHSGNQNALMYYSLTGKTVATLNKDDRDGISYLYPRNEFLNGAFGCGAVHRGQTEPGSQNAWWWLFAVVFLVVLPRLLRPFALSYHRQ